MTRYELSVRRLPGRSTADYVTSPPYHNAGAPNEANAQILRIWMELFLVLPLTRLSRTAGTGEV